MKTEQTAKTDNGGNETKVPKTARRPKNYRISAAAMETPKKGAPERDIEKKGQAMGNARDTGPERRSCP